MQISKKRYLRIPKRRTLITKNMVIDALDSNESISASARWLGVSYNTFKKYVNLYVPELFDENKNQSGRGLNKVHRKSKYDLDSILKGEFPNYPLKNLKRRLIDAGYLKDECGLCGWNENRLTDDKICLHLNHIDGDNKNHKYENLRLLCANCYFTNVGNFLSANKFC